MGRVRWKGGSLSSTLFSSHRPQHVFFFPSPQPPHITQDSAGKSGNTEWLLKSFSSSPGPLYQNEVKCSAFDMDPKWFFIAMQVKLIFTNVHLTSFWKWGVLELRRQWPIHMTVKMTFANSDYLTENQTGAELPLRGGGGGWGLPRLLWEWSPATYMGNKRNFLTVYFPAFQLYLPSNLKILVLILLATNYYSYLREYKKIL